MKKKTQYKLATWTLLMLGVLILISQNTIIALGAILLCAGHQYYYSDDYDI